MAIASTAVREWLQELTLEEKIQLVHGAVDPEGTATGYVSGVERLGIPEFRLVDGPMGVRAGEKQATASRRRCNENTEVPDSRRNSEGISSRFPEDILTNARSAGDSASLPYPLRSE